MESYGPDSLTSWVIAFACCFINMMMFGMARLAGVLFVASGPRFQVSREMASFPYTFANFVRNVSGPLVGYLGQRFGVRSITTFGSFLAAVGIGVCYVAESIDAVTVLWGVVFGIGFGLGNNLLPVSINQYFDKRRATASGISFAGACLGSFILPPIVEILLSIYGLSGTYLLLAGFVLNCVPAALLLKTPKFEIKPTQKSHDNDERRGIISGMDVKLYTAENGSRKSLGNLNSAKNNLSVPMSADEDVISGNSPLTYDERMKRLSTQTLLSEYAVHMSSSEEPLDVDEIIGNSKGRRQVDPAVLEAEVLSMSSHNTDPDLNSERDDVFEKDIGSSSVPCENENGVTAESSSKERTTSTDSLVSTENSLLAENANLGHQNYGYQKDLDHFPAENDADCSSSVQYANGKGVTADILSRGRTISTDSVVSAKNSFFTKNANMGHQNYGYQKDLDHLSADNGVDCSSVPQNGIAQRTFSQSVYDKDAYFNSYQANVDNPKYLREKINVSVIPVTSKSFDSSELDSFKVRHGKIGLPTESNQSEKKESSFWGSYSVIFDPMFNLIAITNAFYTFTFVCIFTIIVDFARDLNIGESNEKYVLMALSVGDLVGRLSLGWVTDDGYMTTTGFTALLFACQGVTTAAIAWSDGFLTLMIYVTLYGLSEAGLIVIFPVIMAQYIDHDKQTVAIPSSCFFSGPVCLAVSPLIGYFRDHLGAYDYIFYLIAIVSFACCFSWMLAPCIARCQKKK